MAVETGGRRNTFLVLAGTTLLLAIIVSASKSPSLEECRTHIDKEKEGCRPLSGSFGWITDLLFAEKHYMKLREKAMAKREQDLVRVKVERGELPKDALNKPLRPRNTQSEGPSLLSRVWNELFAEQRYMKQRNEAIRARERDLQKFKQKRGKIEEPKIELPPIPQVLSKKPAVVQPRAAPLLAVTTMPTVSAGSVLEPASSGSWLYDTVFAEAGYMKIREQAMEERQRDLIRTKVERGDLPEEALDDPTWAESSDSDDEEDGKLNIWDMLFSETRLMNIRKKAMADRQYDMIRTKVERGDLPPEALDNPDLAYDSDSDDDEDDLSLWNIIFSEKRLMAIRHQAMAERKLDLIRTKVDRGELPPEALEQSLDDLEEDESADGGLCARVWDAIFADGRHMEIRKRALEERHRDFIRTKVERGELPPEALDEEYTDSEQSHDDETAQKSIFQRLQNEIFAESRYWKQRNKAIAEREADLRRFKEAQARGETPGNLKRKKAVERLKKKVATKREAKETKHHKDETPHKTKKAKHDKKSQLKIFKDTEKIKQVNSVGKGNEFEHNSRPKHPSESAKEAIKSKAISSDSSDNIENDNETDDESDGNDELSDDSDDTDANDESSKDSTDSDDEKSDDSNDSSDSDDETSDDSSGSDDEKSDDGNDSSDSDDEPSDDSSDEEDTTTQNSESEDEGSDVEDEQDHQEQGKTTKTIKMQPGKPAPVKSAAPKPEVKRTSTPVSTAKVQSQKPAKAASQPPKPAASVKPAQPVKPAARPSSVQPMPPASTATPAPQERARPTARPRQQVEELLGLNQPHSRPLEDAANQVLRELKQVADYSVKPLEDTYSYTDISPRSLGDAEIFAKPMILFLGQLNSGKSTMINYLLGTEATRTTALPGSGQFRVLTHGERDEKHDGAQVARKSEFSGLLKFGEGLIDRLSGRQLKNKLLEKANIVDVPGIMEGRQYNRVYPFNDVCQWFIDRADIIFVVFDPHHLDIGIEMENLLDQLKGRENQVRIVLNKADQVATADLLRIQGGLIWSLSPLLGSTVPPPIFSGSFTAQPYLDSAPEDLFRSQEEALLQNIASGLVRRVSNRIGLVRRHAIRVRNHARMVDCYLTTYLKQITFLSNKKRLADDVVGNPHKYHIYEGISRVTNISRYDLPDPEEYEDFFSIHALYDFPTLESTCTFFKGCPLDTLDVAIHHTLPDLLGKYQKTVDMSLAARRRG